MFSARQFAIVRAALLFWMEEMCPNGDDFMRPYLDSPEIKPLPLKEVARLRKQLQQRRICYGLYNPADRNLVETRLYTSLKRASAACQPPQMPVVVLIPEE